MNKTFDRFLVLLATMGVLIVIMTIVAMATRPVSVVAADSPSTGAAGSESPAAPTVAHVTLGEWTIEGDLTVPPGPVTFEIENRGTVVHNLEIDGVGASPDVSSGDSITWDAGDLSEGTYEVVCAIAGHKEAGMRTTLTVQAGAVPSAGSGGGAHGGPDTDWEALDLAMHESVLAFPAETEGRGNQLLEPTIVDGVKVYELTTEITPWEVEPGRVVDAWSYNGIVPGPMIKVDVGDAVRVIVHNKLPMGTDVHWHGISTPFEMDGVAPLTQPLIHSGETFTYEFVTRRPSIGMYHAHHHGQLQVPNGLFGVFIVGDLPIPSGVTIGGITLPDEIEIAQEIPMVLNDAGVIGFSLNGKSFPATEPYVVDTGDWILVHYYNEGLQIHPMHQHQFPQLVIAKDGFPLDYPYWADTVNVAPGERYSVLMNPNEAGAWVWHCHILNHVEREEGMFGMVTALIVQDT
ncbi:MAG TPA: multicopper oxidase domain-containing protein [Acidimicrobiia bacterium]|nr:multicopper oxidase domain-containing protein [Acidimicrobiia bacterium]